MLEAKAKNEEKKVHRLKMKLNRQNLNDDFTLIYVVVSLWYDQFITSCQLYAVL